MVRVDSILFAVCLAVLVAGCGGESDIAKSENNERGSALYRKAFAAEQSGDIKEAIRLFNKVLIEEPHSFSAHFQLATLLQDHAEDYVGAIYHYKQYLYLRPDAEKSTLAQERIRIAEQLLAPQILRKVGDSVQGISQAHLLKENERLNRIITTLEGEKSVLNEGKATAETELARLKGDNERLRQILSKMRVSEEASAPSESLLKRVEAAVQSAEGEKAAKPDSKALRALRDEASAISEGGGKTETRKPLVDVPSTETMLQKVQTHLAGESEAAAIPPSDKPSDKPDKSVLNSLSLFGKGDKKEKPSKTAGEMRTYVVQPGDTLFRVAEKFYGDSTKWRKIRDANRTRIDPDGRIRAGQIISVP